MHKIARNPLSMISNLYLQPFLQKLTIYANYPKSQKQKNSPFPHFNTAQRSKTEAETLEIAPKVLSVPFLHSTMIPPSFLTPNYLQHPNSSPPQLLLKTQPQPFLVFSMPQLTFYHLFYHCTLGQTIPISSLGTNTHSSDIFFP